MKQTIKQTLRRVVASIIMLALITAPSVAFAHSDEHPESETQTDSKGKLSNNKTKDNVNVISVVTDKKSRVEAELHDKLEVAQQKRDQKTAESKAKIVQKLDDGKRKVCQVQQSGINTVMDTMNKRRQNAFDRISHVSDAVQAFYIKKQLSIGNYSELVATISTAKKAAKVAMDAQQSIARFDCGSEHPQSDIDDFKEKRTTSVDANKAYRDAVKYLGNAIKATVKAGK